MGFEQTDSVESALSHGRRVELNGLQSHFQPKPLYESMILKNYLISSSLKEKNPKCTQHSDEMLHKNPSPFSLQGRKETQEHKHDGTRL